MPQLLVQAPPWVRGRFSNAWAPMEAQAEQLACLPPALWDYLLGCDGGFVVISRGESRYIPGPACPPAPNPSAETGTPPPQSERYSLCRATGQAAGKTDGVARAGEGSAPAGIAHWQMHNLALISVEDLAKGNECPLHTIGHLIDHYLGCKGSADGLWLSEGGGTTPDWQQAGLRLARLFGLGYGVDEVALSNVRDYFAQSLALYCQEGQLLNIADPLIYKWLRNTLWNKTFWQVSCQ